MEIGAGATKASGRTTDALEAIIRRLRASAARPPPPLRCALARTPNNPCYREATTPTRQSGCKTRCESGYAATMLRCQFKQECVLPRHGRRVRAMKVGGHQLVGIAVTVFPVPADFDGGLDAMIQPVVEVLYVNQAMGEPLYN